MVGGEHQSALRTAGVAQFRTPARRKQEHISSGSVAAAEGSVTMMRVRRLSGAGQSSSSVRCASSSELWSMRTAGGSGGRQPPPNMAEIADRIKDRVAST